MGDIPALSESARIPDSYSRTLFEGFLPPGQQSRSMGELDEWPDPDLNAICGDFAIDGVETVSDKQKKEKKEKESDEKQPDEERGKRDEAQVAANKADEAKMAKELGLADDYASQKRAEFESDPEAAAKREKELIEKQQRHETLTPEEKMDWTILMDVANEQWVANQSRKK